MIASLPLPLIVAAAIAVLIPHLSALVNQWAPGFTGVLTLLFAAADGLVVELVHTGSDFSWRSALSKALVAFLTAVVSQYGLLKATPLEGQLQAVGKGSAVPANMHTDGPPPQG